MEKTPVIEAIEREFRGVLEEFQQIIGYHDFRVIAESDEQRIIIADIDVREDLPESDYDMVTKRLNIEVKKAIPSLAYCSFYITPKFAY